MNIGRTQNADPRWILPLICRRGHVSRGDIGAIRITATDTMFEIPKAISAKFLAAVRRTGEAGDEGADVMFDPINGAPREEARGNRKQLRPANGDRPNRSGPPRGGPGAGSRGGASPHSPRPFKGAGAGGPRKGPPRSRG